MALLAYEWPGNIRELENVIHYALIVCRDQQIRAEDLRLVGALHRNRGVPEKSVVPEPESIRIPEPAEMAEVQHIASLYQRLEDLFGELIDADEPGLFDAVEESLIRTVFSSCNQNQVQSARVLGISRNILRTHLKRIGLIGYDPSSLSSDAEPAESAMAKH
jgi:sigma-54-specific transcriptional regulator